MKPPFALEETAEGLRAVIPASEDYVVLWKLGVIWGAWFVLGACLFDDLAREILLYSRGLSNAQETIFMAAAALLLAPKGLRAFSNWGWSVYGTETLILGAENVVLVRSVAGFRRAETYRVGEVKRLRAVSVPHPLDLLWPGPSKLPARGGAAFESGGAEIRFAEGLAPAQAEALVKRLTARCPGLAGT